MEIKDPILNRTNGDADIRFIRVKKSELDHGNELEEIISHKPPFFVRWGTVFFLVLLLMIAFIAWIIQYPDIVVTNGTLNSINAPKEIIARTEGKLVTLFIKEGQAVYKNEVIGYMESTAKHEEVIELSIQLDSVSGLIQRDRTNQILNFSTTTFKKLGELQNAYQTYIQAFQQFTNYLANGFYIRKRQMLREDMGYLQRLHAALLEQKNIFSQDLSMADTTFKANEILKDQKIISPFEYRAEKSKLLSKKMTLPQISSSLITNENQQHEKVKEISEFENQIQQQKSLFVQALGTFKSSVDEWKRKYLLSAPVEGKVAFSSFLQENQQLKAGQLICYINPGNTNYYLEARIPQYNFGKVKIGQEVNLKFPAYPFQEFGKVRGRIELINNIPSDSGYLAKISLPEGLVTSYKKQIQYRSGLSAQADIITSKKSLLRRLLENLIIKTSR